MFPVASQNNVHPHRNKAILPQNVCGRLCAVSTQTGVIPPTRTEESNGNGAIIFTVPPTRTEDSNNNGASNFTEKIGDNGSE